MRKSYFTEDTILLFHKGCGGHFHNSGYVTCKGQHNIGYAVNFLSENVLFAPHDENGYELEDGEFTDCDGMGVGLTIQDLRNGTGVIDLDGEYDTWYTIRVKDLDEKDYEAIVRADSDSYAREQFVLYLLQDKSRSMQEAILDDLNIEYSEFLDEE